MFSYGRKSLTFFLALVIATALAAPALAETLYIRDLVIINLRAEPVPSAETVALLRTGDSFEVLGKEGRYLHVRNVAGQEGWIDAQYAVAEPPSVLEVGEAQAKIAKMTRELEDANRKARTAKAELEETLAQVEKERRESSKKLNTTSGEVGSLSQELSKLKKKYDVLLAKSSNVIEIDAERERLAAQNAELAEELAQTSERAQSLSDAYALKWFFAGAGVLVLGWIFGVVTGRKKKTRSYS
jgi:SH3 domain protein